ncbi:MAG: rhodanese-like domain-containing protein [Verrucomicrobium sp.]|nr:rhodanese-like domain-containing protein [Verrucomicrobium sp.]
MASVSPRRLAELLPSRPAIVDVRAEAVHRLSHIPGSLSAPYAMDVPKGDPATFAAIARQLETLDPAQPVYFVCQLGEYRSIEAAAFAREKGFSQAAYLEGGVTEWRRSRLPLDGTVPRTELAWAAARRSSPAPEGIPARDRSPERA